MYDDHVRTAVALYLTGSLTAAEAARTAEISTDELRQLARTSGMVLAAPTHPHDAHRESVDLAKQD